MLNLHAQLVPLGLGEPIDSVKRLWISGKLGAEPKSTEVLGISEASHAGIGLALVHEVFFRQASERVGN